MSTLEGIIVINKDMGFTSQDVVSKVKSLTKCEKVGHTGTLDPDAQGVLVVCLGNATKISEYLLEKDKEYIATMKLGVVTDTQDMSGKIINEVREFKLEEEEIIKCVEGFLGEYMQTPPIYSAVKIKGKKLYEYARSGEAVKIPARRVEIKEIEVLRINRDEVDIRVLCTKGTYIRTLCYDIGKKLKVGACLKALNRTRSGIFTLEDAIRLESLADMIKAGVMDRIIKPISIVFGDYERLEVKKESYKKLINGNKLNVSDFLNDAIKLEEKVYTIYYEDRFCALYRGNRAEDKIELKSEKMFLGGNL